MMILCIYLIMVVCTHGPSKVARDLFVLSVRESSAGGFLANMVVSKSTIRKLKKGIKWQIQTIQQIRHSLSLIKK